MSIFTATKKAAPAPLDKDYSIRVAWGISQADWQDNMDDSQRAWCRWNLTKAPNFNTEGK